MMAKNNQLGVRRGPYKRYLVDLHAPVPRASNNSLKRFCNNPQTAQKMQNAVVHCQDEVVDDDLHEVSIYDSQISENSIPREDVSEDYVAEEIPTENTQDAVESVVPQVNNCTYFE
ncbi:uncharacterized protein LOC119733884 [Patiria miniata]|uniref:Uncharacterized protein n=1 Tax=Patiria miniata TaxID=46514 RepID=A0A914AI09_PATMI|nr:uncharacterized protein LOC119733884 [Patiria miniata]